MTFLGRAILDGHRVVPVADADWKWLSRDERRVAWSEIGDVRVSTVFLGTDYGWRKGEELWFETMVFGLAEGVSLTEWSATWEEAEAVHQRIVAELSAEGVA